MAFAERVNHEDEREGRSGRVETMVVDGMFHGYLEGESDDTNKRWWWCPCGKPKLTVCSA